MNLSSLRVNTSLEALMPFHVGATRPLTQADIVLLAAEGRGKSRLEQYESPNALKRISERHHALARLIAVGTSQTHASAITGYTKPNIALLMNDPTFCELVDFYAQGVDAEYRTMNAQLAGLGEDAVAELRRRVEDEPEKLGANFLLDVVTKVADRTGNGPTSTQNTNVNVNVGLADRFAAARKRATAAIEGLAKDITPEADA